MLRAATAVRVLPWTQLRVCRPYNCTSVLLQQQLPSNPTTNSIKVKDGEEEKKAVTDGNLDEKLKKIQVFGSENQMNKVSNLLFKVRDIDALLTASIQQLKRHDEQYLKSKGPAFLYIADSLLKDRSPVLHRLLPMIEKSEPAIKLFGSKRLLQASKIFAYDLKLTEDTLTTEDRKYALSNTLFRPTDYKHRKAYKAALNFPNEAFLSFFSIKNKYDTDFLHLHLATRHFVRWLRATKVEELRLKLRLNSFFDLIQDKYQYDPTLTTAILLHNIREFTEADDANKALRRYPNIIFFTACSWLIKHGITQDLHRLYAFVKQFPEFAHPNSVPHDIYSDAIISMFEHFSKSTLSAASSSSSTTTRELSAAEIQQAKLMASFGKHNSFKAAKLRGAFFQTSNSFGYYNLSKLLLQEYYSEYVWLGTMVLNNCIRTFISVGDYATSKELVTMASDEKKLVKLLSSKLAMAENIQKANATEAKEGDSNDVDHTTDSNMLIAEANPLEGLVAIPPTELDVGINVSTLSSYITGLEHYYLAKENATNGLLPTAFVQVTEDFETQASNQILDLLHQMEEYKIIPYISLFKRILALNRSHLHNLTIPHMCIKLALRPGKIQPSDLKSTAVKQWKSRGHRHGDDVEKQMQVIDGKASVPSSFDPNVSSSSSSDGNSLAELMSTSDSQAQLNQALVLLEVSTTHVIINLSLNITHNYLYLHLVVGRSVSRLLSIQSN